MCICARLRRLIRELDNGRTFARGKLREAPRGGCFRCNFLEGICKVSVRALIAVTEAIIARRSACR
eukprot:scaffold628_cov401-Prasinococcus_capsulatus_cf.AAC.8